MTVSRRRPVRTLLIEDSAWDAQLFQEALREAGAAEVTVEWVASLPLALERLAAGSFDLVVADLSLPGSAGLEAFREIRGAVVAAPIVVLSASDDSELALEAVREGAEDYLTKGRMDPAGLARALRQAVERFQTRRRLEAEALADDLTGLHNRRGFIALAGHLHLLARRGGEPMALVFIDLNRMKLINDTFGHAAGDLALRDLARMLRATFRESDVLARIGGDEFCVAMAGPHEDAAVALDRLERAVWRHNASGGRPYRLSYSAGIADYDPQADPSLERLMQEADRRMYNGKARDHREGGAGGPAGDSAGAR